MVERSGRQHGRWRGLCKHCLELSPLCRLNLNRLPSGGFQLVGAPSFQLAATLAPIHPPPCPAPGSIHFDLCTYIHIHARGGPTIEHRSTSTLRRDTQAFTVHGRGTEAWVQLDVCVRSQPRECAPLLTGCHVSTEGVPAGWVNGSTNRLRKNCWVSIIVG